MAAAFAHRFGPWAVVCGASEGIGLAFSKQLAGEGLNLVIIARREGPLKALAEDLAFTYGVSVVPVALDLSADDATSKLEAEIRHFDVGLLIYNACASSICAFAEASPEALDNVVACNCRGIVRTARLIAPSSSRPQGGGLLLMSSMSGFTGHACAAAYAASKAFTTSLGQGLWAELEPKGITVRVCAAGATKTPNFLAATPEEKRGLAMPMDAERVAREALQAMERKGSRGALVVPGILNRFAAFLMRRVLGPTAACRFMSSNLRRIYS